MKHTLAIVAFVVLSLVSSVQPAHANLLDWMQEWSGPGPFRYGGNFLSTICLHPFDVQREGDHADSPCFFIDFRRLIPDDDTYNFPVRVTTTFTDVGITFRLRKPIEVGVGAGLMTAHAPDVLVVRPTLTAPRVVVKPLRLLAEIRGPSHSPLFNENRRIVNMIKFHVTGNVIVGSLTGDDFGATGTNYDRKFEFVMSRGLYLDFIELFAPKKSATF